MFLSHYNGSKFLFFQLFSSVYKNTNNFLYIDLYLVILLINILVSSNSSFIDSLGLFIYIIILSYLQIKTVYFFISKYMTFSLLWQWLGPQYSVEQK